MGVDRRIDTPVILALLWFTLVILACSYVVAHLPLFPTLVNALATGKVHRNSDLRVETIIVISCQSANRRGFSRATE